MDKEKVMTWLEICGKNNDCSGCCPYSENGFGEYGQCRESLMADAYALLKEQEARLLTRSEIQSLEEGQFVWIQTKADGLYHLEIIGICGTPGRYTDIQFNAPKIFPELNINRYMLGWTAWTVQPTKEQMERVKWE